MQKPVRWTNTGRSSSNSSLRSVQLGRAPLLELCSPCCVSVLLEQRVHVQQVVLDGRACDGPAGASPQLTHGQGGLHFWVLDVVSFVQNHPVPGDPEEWRR